MTARNDAIAAANNLHRRMTADAERNYLEAVAYAQGVRFERLRALGECYLRAIEKARQLPDEEATDAR